MAAAGFSLLRLPASDSRQNFGFYLPLPPFPSPSSSSSSSSWSSSSLRVTCLKRTERKGRQKRYPSEKKKMERVAKTLTVERKEEGIWRFHKLCVPFDKDPGKDDTGVSDALLQAVAKVLKFPVASLMPVEAFSVVRKSFDARKMLKEPRFVYTVDMDVEKLLSLQPRAQDFVSHLEPKEGVVEHSYTRKDTGDLISIVRGCRLTQSVSGTEKREGGSHSPSSYLHGQKKKPKVAVVGSGPSGLFAALVLGELGADVTVIERGQPVEQRGRDIGALVVRRVLQPESNFCFGEGGAGTWSDGKLVTRIGRNSDCVQTVLKTLIQFGAPANILVNGKPHLGTDRLVPLLRTFRKHLQGLGVNVMFGTRLEDLVVVDSRVRGVRTADSISLTNATTKNKEYDAVILAVGHSARDVYEMLVRHDVKLVPKDFSVGLRIEHPQEIINEMQYAKLASEVSGGRGKVPVADYKLVKYVGQDMTDMPAGLGERSRSCYSFCMCPGGQVVLTSTSQSELCINGMSFSRRASKWANAALVVTVSLNDFIDFGCRGPLAGVSFQRELEKKAALMGGGDFIVPVQSVPDFLDRKLSGSSLPPSSYRLGVKPADLHQLFPTQITEALQHSITMFDQEMPGFITKNALLHGVETRTSSPVKIPRCSQTYESLSLKGLFPVGEGAGYAGGIVSAAVDGMYCGFAVAKHLNLLDQGVESILGVADRESGFVKY